MNVYVGIDPGLSGAIAFYRPDTHSLKVFDLPTRIVGKSEKKEIDLGVLSSVFQPFKSCIRAACIEEVWAMNIHGRQQGVSSMFSFGKSYGGLLGVLAALKIPTVRVSPAVWKGLMGLSSDKNLSRAIAMQHFPKMEKKFSRKKDDGRAEAALLSHFCSVRFK